MDWILTRLACGSAGDVLALQGQDATSFRPINRIVTLAEKRIPQGVVSSQTFLHHEPIPDEVWLPPDLWQRRVEMVRLFLQAGATVLVQCRLGRSRSPALCAAYLISCGMGIDEARHYIATRRGVMHV